MHVCILGAAAGGGLPQWNCRCANCEAARRGSPDVKARTQSSAAVSADGRAWFLLNASADVRQQVLTTAALWPPEGAARGTTIAGCLLTDAEIDHASGLLQLREGGRFGIYSTAPVRDWLGEFLPIRTILGSFADRPWEVYPDDGFVELKLPDGTESGLRARAFAVGEDIPRFVPPTAVPATGGSVVGLEIVDNASGATLVYAPGVPKITSELSKAAHRASCILIDGTFWTDTEPQETGITDSTSTEMGHLPVSGEGGTLQWLCGLNIAHRVYVHINNTNPMLNDASRQRQEVTDSGVHVAADGDTFEI